MLTGNVLGHSSILSQSAESLRLNHPLLDSGSSCLYPYRRCDGSISCKILDKIVHAPAILPADSHTLAPNDVNVVAPLAQTKTPRSPTIAGAAVLRTIENPRHSYTRVASVSSTGRVSSSLVIVTLNRTSPGFSAVTVTCHVAFAFGESLSSGANVTVPLEILADVAPVDETYCMLSSIVHVTLILVLGAVP